MISILVVDDDSYKLQRIREALLQLGVTNDEIVEAEDAAAARRALMSRSFDVMLLDVLLPARKNATPSGETSLDLLRQFFEDNTLTPPPQILAMTADEGAISDHGEEFRSLTTQVLRVDPASDAWRSSLEIVVNRCRVQDQRVEEFDFDVCLITALRSPEYRAVIDTWAVDWGDETQLAKGAPFRYGYMRLGERMLKVACVHAPSMGLVSAADLACKAVMRLRPRLLLMSGICGGIGDELHIGDLVAAEKAWDWQAGKYTSGGGFECNPDQKDASLELVTLARQLETQLAAIDEEWRGIRPETRLRLHVAPMVSGSAVVADERMHSFLRNQHRKVAAVDMEAYAIYFAAQMAGSPQPKVLCIKGVSDLANAAKANWAQDYCSFISSKFLRLICEKHFAN